MNTISSRDGTRIAYDRKGEGPAIIIVDGAMSRSRGSTSHLVDLLAPTRTVYTYDRRGRGDSGDTAPYAVDREIDDLEALISVAGGSASLYGHSSGACLALDAAVRLGGTVDRLALYEAPYNDDPAARRAWGEYITQLTALLSKDRRGDAVALFMAYVGMPEAQIDGMRQAPFWPSMEAVAPTLAYDHTGILGSDASVPRQRAAAVTAPALVMVGADSPAFMHETARTLSGTIPNAELLTLAGQGHNVDPAALAPALGSFLAAG